MLAVGNGPSHGQEADDGEATQQEEPARLVGPASAEPVVTRAWAHDGFGRLVFDWPRAVEYEANIEDRTLTVMFDHQLKTTFWQVRRYLDAYITDVDLSPDGRSVTASLTGDYRLRTFTLSSESGVAKVVVDMLTDGGASPVLAQAPAPPPPEPSPEAVPGDVPPHPTISGDSPLSPAETVPVDVFPAVAAPTAESAPEAAAEDTPPMEADADAPPTETDTAPETTPPAEATSDVDVGAGLKPAPTAPGDAASAQPVAAPEETPAVETVSTPEAPTVPDDAEDTPQAEAETGIAPAPVTASGIPVVVAEDQTPETEAPPLLSIPVSQSRLFRLDVPVASVFVANPEIADVQLVSSGVLFVVAKAVGRTSVAALDADSDLIAEWTIATVIDVEPVRAALEEVEALKSVSVRQLNRGVELSGVVASVAEADLALRLTTTALPEEIPVENRITVSGAQQINLEVQIAEVQRNVSETLGINWEVVPNLDGDSVAGFRVGRFFFDDATSRFIAAALPGGQAAAAFGAGIAGRTTVRGLIDALATAGLATVLARPNVTAISGETASFFSGGEYPLPAGFEDGAIIFEYKKYGVLLDFVPTIVDSGRIVLTVRPEVSQRSDTDSLTVTGIDIPVINVRRAETTVEVGDGESIVIAGLYRDQSEAVEVGVPVLKDIPLLNLLFGTRTVRSNATELIVVVTARLTEAATVPPRPTDGRRAAGCAGTTTEARRRSCLSLYFPPP
jgi:pilus assembly protein CpaC